MAKKLYVGNLSWGTTTESLKEAFSQLGEVTEAIVMIDKMTNRSRGFGFVTMADDAAADAAVAKFNGSDLDGRQLTVNEARPREDRPQGERAPRRNFDDRRF